MAQLPQSNFHYYTQSNLQKKADVRCFVRFLPTYQRILEKYEGNTTRLQKLFSARLKHDSSYASHGVLRPRMTHPKSPREAPGAVHPLFIRVEEYGDMPIIFREDERMHFTVIVAKYR